MKEVTVKVMWRLYQLSWYVYPKKIIDDYNQYASRGMKGQTYSRGGFQAWKRNQFRGYKTEDEN